MPRVSAHVKRPICERSIAIDVRRWHRDRLLRPGRAFSWTRFHGDESVWEIEVAVGVDALMLIFEWRRRGASEWTRACHRVPVVWTRCHLGGARPWFLCTADAGDGRCCGRRVAKLYTGDSHLFACRWCRRLAYASQSESPLDRSVRRARKIRMRLGGGRNMLEPLPRKPPRMHTRTYDRLLARAMTAQERWIGLQHDYLARHYPGLLSQENLLES